MRLLGLSLVFACAAGVACLSSQAPSRTRQLSPANATTTLTLPPRPSASAILVLRVESVTNPANAAILLATALAPCTAEAPPFAAEPVASLGLFPPDQPGSFTLDTTAAMTRLRARVAPGLDTVCVRVELRRSQPQARWEGVSVTVAPLEWRDKS
jgi:hypothetical protein